MKYFSLALVTLSTLAFVGCKKTVKPATVTEPVAERVSGTHTVDIVWEEIDLK